MARTGTLPTMEGPKHQELCEQARVYAQARDVWLAYGRNHKTEKDKLIELMKAAGLKSYHDAEEDLSIELENGKEHVIVKYGKDEKAD